MPQAQSPKLHHPSGNRISQSWRKVLFLSPMLCPTLLGAASGLLFDVVAGRAVALLVRCSLQEAVLLSIQQLLLQLQWSHYKSKIHVKHLYNLKCNFSFNLLNVIDIGSTPDSPFSYILHLSDALTLRIPQRADTLWVLMEPQVIP